MSSTSKAITVDGGYGRLDICTRKIPILRWESNPEASAWKSVTLPTVPSRCLYKTHKLEFIFIKLLF